eukprot:superscaffoldBa00006718_g21829
MVACGPKMRSLPVWFNTDCITIAAPVIGISSITTTTEEKECIAYFSIPWPSPLEPYGPSGPMIPPLPMPFMDIVPQGDTQSGKEQPIRGEGLAPGYGVMIASRSARVTGNITMVTDQKDNPNPAHPRLQQIQQPQQHLQQVNQHQQLNEQIRQSPSHPLPPLYGQQWLGDGLLHRPHLPFSPSPIPQTLTALGGARGILGTPPVWSGGLGPAGASLVWGFQRTGRDFNGSGLLGGYHNPAGQSSNRHRGGARGGGYNGM